MIHRIKQTLPAIVLVVVLLAAGTLAALARNGQQAQQPTVVVLSASWCATCREITPLVRNIVRGNQGMDMVVLDVDEAGARSQAGTYGINIEGTSVPQVYLVNNGRTVMIFNGKNYKFGQSRQAEAQIRQGLSTAL